MNKKPNKFWCDWLITVVIGVSLFSIALVFLPKLTHLFFNWIAFLGEPPVLFNNAEVSGYLSFVYGLLGAVMLGWSLVFYFVVQGPFRAGEPWSWYALAVPISAWFVVDSTHSVITGYWANALFNTGFFLAFAIPLLATYSSLKR